VRHVGSVFDLSPREIASIWELAREVRDRHCDGYTIGINDGPAAGQTVPHMHLHLIPRMLGDVPNPRGGIRNIFPNDEYSKVGA
jgi:diadenosine tetraphosphate (Ap4A) HIT family hydrolase